MTYFGKKQNQNHILFPKFICQTHRTLHELLDLYKFVKQSSLMGIGYTVIILNDEMK
jgi:hypothetical protein